MVGIALLLDLLKTDLSLSTQCLHSYNLFSAVAAASAAAASIGAGKPFASRKIFSDCGPLIAHCDAGQSEIWNGEGYISTVQRASGIDFHPFSYRIKEYYPIQLKPLFSAFKPKTLAITSLRSFMLHFYPLLQHHHPEDEDDDILHEASQKKPADLVTPLLESVKQIIRETAIVTTRRVLERYAVRHLSRRMAWKLLKDELSSGLRIDKMHTLFCFRHPFPVLTCSHLDVPTSAKRKAERGMPTIFYLYSVSRTTFRVQLLGVAASWFVQVVIEIYRCFFLKGIDVSEDIIEKIRRFKKKSFGITIKCSASLAFASIGAGIGALFHPSAGQLVGCTIGDFAGPMIAIVCLKKFHLDI